MKVRRNFIIIKSLPNTREILCIIIIIINRREPKIKRNQNQKYWTKICIKQSNFQLIPHLNVAINFLNLCLNFN